MPTALAKAYAACWRVRAAQGPVAYARGVLVKSLLSDRRRRSSRELPTAPAPELTTTDPRRPAGRC